MPTILIIEDDANLQFVLADNFTNDGYTVVSAEKGRDGLARALSGTVDLVVLDLMLPDLDGIEVCKQIRAHDRRLPILMLTAKAGEVDRVVGLEVGADDYVTKPFSMRELLARIRAALRRAADTAPRELDTCWIGDALIDFTTRELVRGERREKLTRYESDLLRFLAMHRGRAMSRERILQDVWGTDGDAGNRTVDNYIVRLRAKVEPVPAAPQHLLTVHGTGYKLA